MFKITSGKGFHVTFPNGYTVSVQWGSGNWAETAVWGPDGELLPLVRYEDDGRGYALATPRDGEYVDTVQGWQSPLDVLRLMEWAAAQPAPASTHALEGQ